MAETKRKRLVPGDLLTEKFTNTVDLIVSSGCVKRDSQMFIITVGDGNWIGWYLYTTDRLTVEFSVEAHK